MAFDAFLKIDGIDGESLDKNHKDEIEIDSYSWGVANTGCFGTAAGEERARPSHRTSASPRS